MPCHVSASVAHAARRPKQHPLIIYIFRTGVAHEKETPHHATRRDAQRQTDSHLRTYHTASTRQAPNNSSTPAPPPRATSTHTPAGHTHLCASRVHTSRDGGSGPRAHPQQPQLHGQGEGGRARVRRAVRREGQPQEPEHVRPQHLQRRGERGAPAPRPRCSSSLCCFAAPRRSCCVRLAVMVNAEAAATGLPEPLCLTSVEMMLCCGGARLGSRRTQRLGSGKS